MPEVGAGFFSDSADFPGAPCGLAALFPKLRASVTVSRGGEGKAREGLVGAVGARAGELDGVLPAVMGRLIGMRGEPEAEAELPLAVAGGEGFGRAAACACSGDLCMCWRRARSVCPCSSCLCFSLCCTMARAWSRKSWFVSDQLACLPPAAAVPGRAPPKAAGRVLKCEETGLGFCLHVSCDALTEAAGAGGV